MTLEKKNRLGQRLRRFRNKRGAAMVEALVAIPFFVVIFVLAIFLGQLYREKIRTLRESKQAAWVTAMDNCSGPASTQSAGMDYLSQGAENNPTMGAPGTEIYFRPFNEATQFVDGQAQKYQIMYSQGFLRGAGSRTTVMCNEPPVDGQFRLDFLYTYHKLTPW